VAPHDQRREYDLLVAAPHRHKRKSSAPAAGPAGSSVVPDVAPMVKLRVVAYFNQERFVERRYRANAELAEIRAFIDDLNGRLVRSGSRRTRASIEAEVDRKLRERDLVEAFKLNLNEEVIADRTRYRVDLHLDEANWARRRRHDGFSILVAHPELPQTAAQLCRLYRAKDVVEKDFHIIKSVVEVAPVRHYADSKVRAHVTLCMLALLLERTLQHRLRGKCSPEAALELLEPCRLNRFASETRAYGLTRPTTEQKEILRHLGLSKLIDDETVSERLSPR
jgi:hypothetical protein